MIETRPLRAGDKITIIDFHSLNCKEGNHYDCDTTRRIKGLFVEGDDVRIFCACKCHSETETD
jgi:hypothetical protein